MRSRVLFLAIPLTLGALAYALTLARSHGRLLGSDGPSIEVPDSIDLGTRNPGPAQVLLTVRNTGNQPLNLTNIKPGCGGCVSVRLADNPVAPLTQLTIAPQGSADLLLDFSVHGSDQAEFRTVVSFTTDDPDRPQVSLPCVGYIAGSISAHPAHWLVGHLTAEERRTIRIKIRDTGRVSAGVIDRATSSNPAVVRVRLLGIDEVLPDPSERPGSGLTAVAELELVAPETPGPIDVDVRIFERGSEAPVIIIPVSGQVLARVRAVPVAALLPRQTGSGQSDEVNLIIQSPTGESFTLKTVDLHGLEVTMPPPGEPKASYVVTVRWPPSLRPGSAQTDRREVIFSAQFPDRITRPTVPVMYRTPGSTGTGQP